MPSAHLGKHSAHAFPSASALSEACASSFPPSSEGPCARAAKYIPFAMICGCSGCRAAAASMSLLTLATTPSLPGCLPRTLKTQKASATISSSSTWERKQLATATMPPFRAASSTLPETPKHTCRKSLSRTSTVSRSCRWRPKARTMAVIAPPCPVLSFSSCLPNTSLEIASADVLTISASSASSSATASPRVLRPGADSSAAPVASAEAGSLFSAMLGGRWDPCRPVLAPTTQPAIYGGHRENERSNCVPTKAQRPHAHFNLCRRRLRVAPCRAAWKESLSSSDLPSACPHEPSRLRSFAARSVLFAPIARYGACRVRHGAVRAERLRDVSRCASNPDGFARPIP
mmetsp:Transcript_16449/g.62508  ORF Transcript_16449/g.62508 Transcript_16449/m.62508 type:complete len:346 (+) Transcript_16449:450-1487(+)